MAVLPPKNDEKEGPSIKSLGNFPVAIESFDPKTNSIEGRNLRDPSAGMVSIRLATANEIADIYLNRNKFPTEAERTSNAEQQIKKRPSVSSLNSKLSDGDGLVGQVVQVQGVREKPNGDMIARWVKPLTAQPEIDNALRGQVQFFKVETKSQEFRKANVLFPKLAEPLDKDSLDRNLQNQTQDFNGTTVEGEVQSRPMVVLMDKEGNMENGFLYTMKESKEDGAPLRVGADGSDSAFRNIQVNKWNHRVMAAAAGRADIELGDLKGFDNLDEGQKQAASAIHDMARNGQVETAIVPGFQTVLLSQLHERILGHENGSQPNSRHIGSLTSPDRGYFEADISLRTYMNDGDQPVIARMKEMEAAHALAHPNASHFVKRERDGLAKQSLQHARDNFGGLEGLMKPTEVALKATQEQKTQQERSQSAQSSLAGPSMT